MSASAPDQVTQPQPATVFPTKAESPWTEFGLSVLLSCGLPLAPVFFEGLFTGRASLSPLAAATSLYALTIAMTTQAKILFGFGLVVGLGFAAVFGNLMAFQVIATAIGAEAAGRMPLPPSSGSASWLFIGVFFVLHTIERFFRHVRQGEIYFQFDTGGKR